MRRRRGAAALLCAAAARHARGDAADSCAGNLVKTCPSVHSAATCGAAHEENPALPGQGHNCLWYSAFPPAACVAGGQCASTKCGVLCSGDSDCAGGPGGCSVCVVSGKVAKTRVCLQPAPPPAPPLPPAACNLLDLVFLLDASTSIAPPDWQTDVDAVHGVSEAFDFDCDKGSRMGIIQFASQGIYPPDRPSTRVEAGLTCDKAGFEQAAAAMSQLGGGTPTGEAMAAAAAMLGASGRPGARKVVLLITDGQPDGDPDWSQGCNTACQVARAQNVSAQLRGEGALILAIAVGDFNGTGLDFIDSVASPPAVKHVYNPQNWGRLIPALSWVVNAICSVTPAPTPAPTPVPTPAPTPGPPLSSAPCLRFGNTVPLPHKVDVRIEQQLCDACPRRSAEWAGYGFGDFSDWTSSFEDGPGTLTAWESVGGARGAELLRVDVPLTPGPLVVALKCPGAADGGCVWPPAAPRLGGDVEAIAASFTPPGAGAVARLFNLAPSVAAAALGVRNATNASAAVASGVAFSLGSDWAPVPGGAARYAASGGSGAELAATTYTPDPAPGGVGAFTMWLLGDPAAAPPLAPRLLPLADAPERGRCQP